MRCERLKCEIRVPNFTFFIRFRRIVRIEIIYEKHLKSHKRLKRRVSRIRMPTMLSPQKKIADMWNDYCLAYSIEKGDVFRPPNNNFFQKKDLVYFLVVKM
jgi:hypothetical protein